jgi:FAD binding domain/Berberine and berberine like
MTRAANEQGGTMTDVVTGPIDGLRAAARGDVIERSDPRYDEARKLYNAMIDKRPEVIARCVDAADVIAAVKFGRESGLDTAIRGGGHNGPGLGSVDDGLVIDLSRMRGVRVDPEARTATVGGGALIGDVDHATIAFGLSLPAGIISTTGVGGLTLGGGTGHLSRGHGLTIDHLRSADVVLADGSFVHASEDENDDLFWALRGGGGNFGVVTSFTFDLVPVATVVAGPMFWPIERTEEILDWYRGFIGEQPGELGGFFNFHSVPPAPMFPEELHLKKVCGVVWCCTDPARADELLAPARALDPVLDGVMEMPLPMLNAAFDELYGPGDQWYWRTAFVKDVPDEAVALNAEWGPRMPTWKSGMHFYPIDGPANSVGKDETAWTYRDANFVQTIVGVDPDPGSKEALREWVVGYFEALDPHSMGAGYVNMMMEEGEDRVRASYGENYDRLANIKAKYDPDNFFHVNQNIKPAA